jgi:hypothetical protein
MKVVEVEGLPDQTTMKYPNFQFLDSKGPFQSSSLDVSEKIDESGEISSKRFLKR